MTALPNLPNLPSDPLASYVDDCSCPYDCDHPIPRIAARGPFRVSVFVGAKGEMEPWIATSEDADEADAIAFLRDWIEDSRFNGCEIHGADGLLQLSAGRLVMAYRCSECADSGRVMDSRGDDGRLVACECAAGAKWERVGNRFWRV